MSFVWDIYVWIVQMLAEDLNSSPMTEWLKVVFKPLTVLYDEFIEYRTEAIKKMRYNAQTIILRNLLNDLFDPTDRRIRIITTYDTIKPIYIFDDDEGENPVYIYDQDEYDADPTLTKVYLFDHDEMGVLYDFIVEAAPGSLTDEQIVRLKATVDYYRLYGKRPGYYYSDSTQF